MPGSEGSIQCLTNGCFAEGNTPRYDFVNRMFCLSDFDDLVAKFVVEIKGYTVNDEDLVCVNLKVDFMRRMSLERW